MSASRAKRQFAGAASDPAQRQITSFFQTTTAADSSSSSTAARNASQPSRPVLPADTQSDLLNVGMRVRKSVPEGYKTGTYSAFGLFGDLDKKQQPTVTDPTSTARAAPCPPSSSSYGSNGQRELLPFCGINKVGGLSSQPTFSLNVSDSTPVSSHILATAGLSLPDIDEVPSLSSSQESVASSTSALSVNTDLTTPGANRKRVYDEGEQSDTPSVKDCLRVPSGSWLDGEVSPRSLVPAGWGNTRVMAIPRKIRRTQKLGLTTNPTLTITGRDEKSLSQLGQENMAVDEDFPEADFLDYGVLSGDPMDI